MLIRTILFCLLLLSPLARASDLNSYVNYEYLKLKQLAPHLNDKVLKLALLAYANARLKGLDQSGILTIVDFSEASNQKRLWVIDVTNEALLYSTLVTHGSGSGFLYAKHFSNQANSHDSSIGLYLTQKTYHGRVGYALRLEGLDKGYNDNAKDRAIVVHGASYADASYVAKYGRLGRSWGCFALPESLYRPVINTIKQGTLIFAYYPDQSWMLHSPFLKNQQITDTQLEMIFNPNEQAATDLS